MDNSRPTLTVLAGPNGAGKTRFSPFFVSTGLLSVEPINTDQIADSIDESKFSFDILRFEEQRTKETNKIFTETAKEAIQKNRDFSFESNISTPYQLNPIGWFDAANYNLVLIYIILDSLELSYNRVKQRVNEKGHSVNKEDIKSNFYNGLRNLNDSFKDWDRVIIINNSSDMSTSITLPNTVLIAENGNIIYNNNFPPTALHTHLSTITELIHTTPRDTTD